MTDVAVPAVGQDAPRARPGRRFSWAWLGLAPVPRLRSGVPDHPDVLSRHRQLPDRVRRADAPELRRPEPAHHRRGVPGQHRDQRGDRRGRRDLRLPARVRRHPGRAAALPRRGADDLLRCRLELRRRPTCARVHVHAGRDRARHDPAATSRDRPEERRFHDLLEARPRDRVPLLPVPVDGPDHGARHPGPQDGMARGIGEHGRQHLPVLAAHRAADPDADAARDDDPAVRQCVRRAGDGLHADR